MNPFEADIRVSKRVWHQLDQGDKRQLLRFVAGFMRQVLSPEQNWGCDVM